MKNTNVRYLVKSYRRPQIGRIIDAVATIGEAVDEARAEAAKYNCKVEIILENLNILTVIGTING